MITGKTYDVLKFLAMVAFPALGTLYFTLATIWGLPAAEQVVGTIVAIDTFLGILLQISSSKFTSNMSGGTIVVNEMGDKKVLSLELDEDPDAIEPGKKVLFKVEKGPSG
jgi:hypothetical protein